MNAKNGELAIARFDPMDEGEGWTEHICFVTGREKSKTKFVYWEHKSNGTIMYADDLPKSRVISVVPKPGKELIFLSGEFYKLTIDDVVPATQENMAALCLSVSVNTSKVKLGGCYHTGKAYCLGYRNSCDGEVELDTKVFTCLDSGVDGGAMAALNQHKERFDCSADIPRFIVELAAVRIIAEDTDVGLHVGPDVCDGCLNSIEHCVCCKKCSIHVDFCHCDETCEGCCNLEEDCTCESMCEECHGFDCACDEKVCVDCGEELENCTCYEVGKCYACGVVKCICIEDDDDFDDDGYCNRCGEICTDCECDDDDLDDENVDQTFHKMNAFARTRWLKSKKEDGNQ